MSTVKEDPRHADDRQWATDGLDEHLVSLVDPASFEADQYRTLRLVVEQLHAAKRMIAVTSAVAGDGKTTTAINFAGTLALAADAHILIMDLDLRTPSVAKRLGLAATGPGLADLLLDPDLTIEDVTRRHSRFRLSVIPAGRALSSPYELLKSPRMGEVMHQARQQYDFVVVDTPPLVPVPDCRLIAGRVDGVVLVVAAHRTPRPLFEDTLDMLEPSKVIGIVFNGDDRRFSHYHGYYYGYGHRRSSRRQGIGGRLAFADRVLTAFSGRRKE